MHGTGWTLAAGLVALGWVGLGTYLALGWKDFEGLVDASVNGTAPGRPGAAPGLSVIIAARNEAESIGDTLERLAQTRYPDLEIVAVDDRSTDGTFRIASDHAAANPALKVLKIGELPREWLGKTHALHEGYRNSSGEWLCFMDADVALEPDCLARAIEVVERRRLAHLCLLPALRTHGFIEGAFVMAFVFYFGVYFQPWRAKDMQSSKFCGVGAFNLIRRDVYEAVGGHERLRMEVADDVKLGKLVKRGGYRQDAMDASGRVRLRWQKGGIGAYLKGIEKNAFAGLDYSLARVLGGSVAVLLLSVFPFVGLVAGDAPVRLASAVSVATVALAYIPITRQRNGPTLGFMTHPLGAMLLLWGLWLSTVKTLGRGTVVWRGTAYPLDLLRKHRV